MQQLSLYVRRFGRHGRRIAAAHQEGTRTPEEAGAGCSSSRLTSPPSPTGPWAWDMPPTKAIRNELERLRDNLTGADPASAKPLLKALVGELKLYPEEVDAPPEPDTALATTRKPRKNASKKPTKQKSRTTWAFRVVGSLFLQNLLLPGAAGGPVCSPVIAGAYRERLIRSSAFRSKRFLLPDSGGPRGGTRRPVSAGPLPIGIPASTALQRATSDFWHAGPGWQANSRSGLVDNHPCGSHPSRLTRPRELESASTSAAFRPVRPPAGGRRLVSSSGQAGFGNGHDHPPKPWLVAGGT